jgi:hypothetical protein
VGDARVGAEARVKAHEVKLRICLTFVVFIVEIEIDDCFVLIILSKDALSLCG